MQELVRVISLLIVAVKDLTKAVVGNTAAVKDSTKAVVVNTVAVKDLTAEIHALREDIAVPEQIPTRAAFTVGTPQEE